MRRWVLSCLIVAMSWGFAGVMARAGEPGSVAAAAEVEVVPLFNKAIAGAPYPVRVRVRTADRPLRGWLVARERYPPWGPSVRLRVEMAARSHKELWLLLRPAGQTLSSTTAVQIALMPDEARGNLQLAPRVDASDDDSPAEGWPAEEAPESSPRGGVVQVSVGEFCTLRFQVEDAARERILVIGSGVPVPRGKSGMAADSDDVRRRSVWSLAPDRVPPLARALEGFTTVVLTADAIAEMQPVSLQAVVDWCRQGGRLVVGGGRNPEALRASSLGGALPMDVTGSQLVAGPDCVRAVTGLGAGGELRTSETLQVVSGELLPDARVIVAGDSGIPLIMARAHGAGEVVLVALPLGFGPLARRSAALALWSRLLPVQVSAADRTPEDWSFLADDADMEMRIFGALMDALPRRPIGVGLLLLAMLCYVVALGPGDYWLVVRWARRPILTWVTFPLLVVGFAALAWLGGRAGATGLARATALCFVETDSAGVAVCGVGWVNVVSPSNRKFLVRLDRDYSSVTPCLAELEKDSAFLNDDWLEVRRRDSEACEVPIHVGTSRTLRFDWVEPEGAGEPPCHVELIREAGEVVGVKAWPVQGGPEILMVRARWGDQVWEQLAADEPLPESDSASELRVRFASERLVDLTGDEVPDLDWEQKGMGNPHLALLPALGRVSLGSLGDRPLSVPSGLRDLAHSLLDHQVVVAVFLDGLPVGVLDGDEELPTQGITCVRRVLER